MNLKSKIKSYNFWVSLGSAVLLLLNLLGRQFNFSIDECLYNDILTAICGILVILGIITMPAGTNQKLPTQQTNDSILNQPFIKEQTPTINQTNLNNSEPENLNFDEKQENDTDNEQLQMQVNEITNENSVNETNSQQFVSNETQTINQTEIQNEEQVSIQSNLNNIYDNNHKVTISDTHVVIENNDFSNQNNNQSEFTNNQQTNTF